MKTGLTKKLTETLDITPTDLCETSSDNSCTNCKVLHKLVELMKGKLKLVCGKEQIRILTIAQLHPKVGVLKKLFKILVLLN